MVVAPQISVCVDTCCATFGRVGLKTINPCGVRKTKQFYGLQR
jgi:hypothetical protein